MRRRSFIASLVLMTAAIGAVSAQAPRQRPLAPVPPDGQRVAPFFDGFYENEDGTITLSFGYSNLNRDADDRDSARPEQLHRTERVRRPPADIVSGELR